MLSASLTWIYVGKPSIMSVRSARSVSACQFSSILDVILRLKKKTNASPSIAYRNVNTYATHSLRLLCTIFISEVCVRNEYLLFKASLSVAYRGSRIVSDIKVKMPKNLATFRWYMRYMKPSRLAMLMIRSSSIFQRR